MFLFKKTGLLFDSGWTGRTCISWAHLATDAKNVRMRQGGGVVQSCFQGLCVLGLEKIHILLIFGDVCGSQMTVDHIQMLDLSK